MNRYLTHKNLPWLTLGCGFAGLLLRFWLQSTENDKGFLARPHISGILLLILTAAFLGLTFWMTRDLLQAGKYRFNFPASPVGAAGCALAAAGLAITGIVDLIAAGDGMSTLTAVTGILAAVCLGLAAFHRLQGSRPSMLLHAAVCLWLMLRLISLYRSWSSDPRLEDYAFQLFALVFGMLAAYQRAAFALEEAQRSLHAFFSLGCVYFCCLSLGGPDSILPYLSLGIWFFTDLCDLTPMPRRFRSVKP